jgi:hypothetical protein
MDKQLRRTMMGGVLACVLGFVAFLRVPGAENVRAVQIVALLAAGMGLGIALSHLRLLLGLKSRS